MAFASLWAVRPANLLLDEPTSNLDLPAVADMAGFVARAKEAGCAVLVAEHRLSWVTGIADRYVRMEAGRVDRVWGADEFAALSAEEVRRMGLRMRSADEARAATDASYAKDQLCIRAQTDIVAIIDGRLSDCAELNEKFGL